VADWFDEQGIDVPDGVHNMPAPPQSNVGPDAGALEQQVRALAAQHGIEYHPSDLEDVLRNGGNVGIAATKYAQRASSNGRPDEPSSPQAYSFASGAPQSIQPYSQPFAFDASKLGQTDGFKFRFDKAMQAIERSGAAKGTLFNPQTWKSLQSEASGLASQETDAEFGRQASTYDRNLGVHQWNESSRFDSQRANRGDDFSFMDANRRFGLSADQFARGNFESDRGFDYTRERDRIGDEWRFIDMGYGAARN
jgi:hypothetical protein